MYPFSEWGPFDHSERKALLIAALFSFVFIVFVALVRPSRQSTTTQIEVPVLTTTPNSSRADVSVADGLEKFRVKPHHFEPFDFNNYSYGRYALAAGKKIDLHLRQGLLELPNNPSWFELRDVYYTDMTGDGKAEAIVRIYHVTCGVSCDGGTNMFYIYTESKGKLKPIWQYETGSYAEDCGLQSFTAGGTEIMLGLFGRCDRPGAEDPTPSKFMSKGVTSLVFEFNGRRLEPKTSEYFDSRSIDTSNYEPEIRIF